MLETILYAVGFFIFTIFLQWLLHKVRKNHNQGNSAIWVGSGAIIVICVMGLMTKNVDYFAALLGFIVGDEDGKQAVETHCKLRKAGGSMVENNRLPDTPWHVGYAKKQENDPRRHKARCIHYRDGQCGWKANYSGKCIGSSHSMDYSESLEDFKK